MTPEELAAEIERLITEGNIKFSEAIIKVQNSVYTKLIAKLKGLELDDQGYIKQNSANRQILREAQSDIDSAFVDNAYVKAVESQLKLIPKIDALNAEYFKTISESFSSNRNFIKELQKQTIELVNTNLLNEGVISQVKAPLNQILSQNISSGGSFAGFTDQLRDFIKGSDKAEGRLLSYTRTYTSDTLFNYSRAWQEATTADLGLDYYLYAGGLTGGGKNSGGSRDFCIQRIGNYYHRKEIEKMASLSWKGKNPLTTKSSIFILAGGFNCKHSIIPVHSSIVPKEVIERNN